MSNQILGGVLTYTIKTKHSIGGQIVGADGSGEYAVLIYGDPDKSEIRARQYINHLESEGHFITKVTYVSATEDGYYGSRITLIDLQNQKERTVFDKGELK
jgi:hypothetical protein